MSDNGDLLECLRELEDAVVPEHRHAVRRVAAHFLRVEEVLREMQETHTDPNTGRLLDVRSAYIRLDRAAALAEDLDTRWQSIVWMSRGMLAMMGAATVLAGFIFWQIHGEVRRSTDINQEQTLLIRDLQVVQRNLVEQVRELRQRDARFAYPTHETR